MDPADFVLEPLRREASEQLAALIPTAAQCVMTLLERGVDATMREYNAD